MSYIQKNLMPNERVLLTAHISPAVFLPSVISFIGSFFLFVYAISSGGKQNQTASTIAVMTLCVAALFLFYSIMLAAQAIIVMSTTEFAVTNRRVIAKTGFIRRNTLELLLLKVESVSVHQSILARLLNFGTVIVTGTVGTKGGFRGIVDPLTIRRKINQVVEAATKQAYSQQQSQPNLNT
jgi:uncharacterized membrane protein YdbT with pleckstrin-like domain